MKPEILLKAYVQYQSEDAFRDLVASTLDEVYSTSLRIVNGAPYLAEEIALGAYSELALKAPTLSHDLVLASWRREHTCRMAVRILRAKERVIDWAALKREKNALPAPAGVQLAPPGLAIRICQSIYLSTPRHRGHGLFSPRVWLPIWIRPRHVGGVAVCVLVMVIWWNIPFHRRNPIIRSQGSQLTPSAFAQLASPEEGGPPRPNSVVDTNAEIHIKQK
jgi:hypothetical protein